MRLLPFLKSYMYLSAVEGHDDDLEIGVGERLGKLLD